MCGIILLAGAQARARVEACLDRLRHRGPDSRAVWSQPQLALGFARLEINGAGPLGHQPSRHSALIGAINGEIYDHHALAATHGLTTGPCDTRIVLPLVERLGPRVIDELDGFYSGVVLRPGTAEVLCLRDHMGKKPLFVGRSAGEIFIASELKALDQVDWFDPLPRGASSVDLTTGQVQTLAAHRAVTHRGSLPQIFERAVRKRLPHPDQPVAVFLSGGLDSSLVAAFVARVRRDAVHFTLGGPDSPDQRAALTVARSLGLRDVRVVPLPAPDHMPDLIRRVVYATESFNPSIVSNGLATYLLAAAARAAGIKVALTGEGADELFGGYHWLAPDSPWRQIRTRLIDDMHFTELRRLDLSCMAHGVEPRCPYLDREVRSYSDDLGYSELYSHDRNKVALRGRMEGHLPPELLQRPKVSLDVGSGLRREVVQLLRRNGRRERDELRALWRELFRFDASNSYFHAYPTFDAAIDARGELHR